MRYVLLLLASFGLTLFLADVAEAGNYRRATRTIVVEKVSGDSCHAQVERIEYVEPVRERIVIRERVRERGSFGYGRLRGRFSDNQGGNGGGFGLVADALPFAGAVIGANSGPAGAVIGAEAGRFAQRFLRR